MQFYVTHKAFARVPTPLPRDASPKLFSEGRALKHTAYLSDRVGERQVRTVWGWCVLGGGWLGRE